MKWSLSGRLALWLTALVCAIWIAAVAISASVLSREMSASFDQTMQQAALRLLPLATHEASETLQGDEADEAQLVEILTEEGANYTYYVLDPFGRIILFSGDRVSVDMASSVPPGFSTLQGARAFAMFDPVTGFGIVVRERPGLRDALVWQSFWSLALPLAFLIPLMGLAVWWITQRSLRPLQSFGHSLTQRSGRNLAPLSADGQPVELLPIIDEANSLFARLTAALDAERAFAAESAHELRTPIAGALAQLQVARQRLADGSEVENIDLSVQALKKLARLSEGLLQMSRMDAGFALSDTPVDLVPVLEILVKDLDDGSLDVTCSPCVFSISADAFSIVARNLIENAMRYRTRGTDIRIDLSQSGLVVENDCEPIDPAEMPYLTQRFARAGRQDAAGTGLGLAIVAGVASAVGADFKIRSPIPGRPRGFSVSFGF